MFSSHTFSLIFSCAKETSAITAFVLVSKCMVPEFSVEKKKLILILLS